MKIMKKKKKTLHQLHVESFSSHGISHHIPSDFPGLPLMDIEESFNVIEKVLKIFSFVHLTNKYKLIRLCLYFGF
jgi:hypothetical protein